jgi:hypothetical protein
MDMTIQQVEDLLLRMRADEASKTRDAVERTQKEREAAEAARAAEDAARLRQWREDRKQSSIRLIVPPGLAAPVEWYGHGRHYYNHRGELVRGMDVAVADVEDGVAVVYVRSPADVRILTGGKDGLAWERHNSEVLRRLASTMPSNAPLPPDQMPAYR